MEGLGRLSSIRASPLRFFRLAILAPLRLWLSGIKKMDQDQGGIRLNGQ